MNHSVIFHHDVWNFNKIKANDLELMGITFFSCPLFYHVLMIFKFYERQCSLFFLTDQTHYQTVTTFDATDKKAFENIVKKKENVTIIFFFFLQCFLASGKKKLRFQATFDVSYKCFSFEYARIFYSGKASLHNLIITYNLTFTSY